MSKFSRFLNSLLAVVLCVLCAGCATTPNKEEKVSYVPPGHEKAITCMVWDRGDFPEGYTADDNTLANWIRSKVMDECGIDVHYVSVGRADSDDVIKKMVDEGTAPDIIFTYSPSVFGYMSQHGKIADLTDSYKKYGKNISEYIGNIQYMGEYNDLQAAIIKRRGFKMPRHMAYIRKDWCEELGMEIPTTRDELIDYLYAVRDNAPGGEANIIPWGMGGVVNSEKYYQSFVNSYVGELSEKDAYIYSERYMVLADGALEGLRELNRLYNDRIISLDFAADLDSSVYKKDVEAGKVGFLLDDTTAPFEYISELKKKDPSAEFVPILCLDKPGGGYLNVTEPDFGLYIMVPAVSKDKTDDVMKYLDWLANPKNAEMVRFTPDHPKSESGAATSMLKDELYASGYPGTPSDYCIVNEHFSYIDDKEAQISTWSENSDWESYEWFEGFFDNCLTDQYTFPKTNVVLEAESKYQVNLDNALVSYAYNLICCPTADFDKVQAEEYERLKGFGLEDVLRERAEYYDSGEARFLY